MGTPVSARDKVSTGPGSMAVVVIKDDAFLIRRKPVTLEARSATIGIRGTGAYLEVDPGWVYFCLCYGEADLDGPGMSAPGTIGTTHHESPRVITDSGGAMAALPGPVVNHTDDELTLLESPVGREPPFAGTPFLNRH